MALTVISSSLIFLRSSVKFMSLNNALISAKNAVNSLKEPSMSLKPPRGLSPLLEAADCVADFFAHALVVGTELTVEVLSGGKLRLFRAGGAGAEGPTCFAADVAALATAPGFSLAAMAALWALQPLYDAG